MGRYNVLFYIKLLNIIQGNISSAVEDVYTCYIITNKMNELTSTSVQWLNTLNKFYLNHPVREKTSYYVFYTWGTKCISAEQCAPIAQMITDSEITGPLHVEIVSFLS